MRRKIDLEISQSGILLSHYPLQLVCRNLNTFESINWFFPIDFFPILSYWFFLLILKLILCSSMYCFDSSAFWKVFRGNYTASVENWPEIQGRLMNKFFPAFFPVTFICLQSRTSRLPGEFTQGKRGNASKVSTGTGMHQRIYAFKRGYALEMSYGYIHGSYPAYPG